MKTEEAATSVGSCSFLCLTGLPGATLYRRLHAAQSGFLEQESMMSSSVCLPHPLGSLSHPSHLVIPGGPHKALSLQVRAEVPSGPQVR